MELPNLPGKPAGNNKNAPDELLEFIRGRILPHFQSVPRTKSPYFTITYTARTPSFQLIFLPSW